MRGCVEVVKKWKAEVKREKNKRWNERMMEDGKKNGKWNNEKRKG